MQRSRLRSAASRILPPGAARGRWWQDMVELLKRKRKPRKRGLCLRQVANRCPACSRGAGGCATSGRAQSGTAAHATSQP